MGLGTQWKVDQLISVSSVFFLATKIGSFLLGFSDVESEFTWPLAYAFYGFGGCCVHLAGAMAEHAPGGAITGGEESMLF